MTMLLIKITQLPIVLMTIWTVLAGPVTSEVITPNVRSMSTQNTKTYFGKYFMVRRRPYAFAAKCQLLLLLDRLYGAGMHLFVLDLRGIPAAAKGFDQCDLGHHLLPEQLCRQPLVR